MSPASRSKIRMFEPQRPTIGRGGPRAQLAGDLERVPQLLHGDAHGVQALGRVERAEPAQAGLETGGPVSLPDRGEPASDR